MKNNFIIFTCYESFLPGNILFLFAIGNLWHFHRNKIVFKNTSQNHDLGKVVIHAASEHMFCASQFGMVKRMHAINV